MASILRIAAAALFLVQGVSAAEPRPPPTVRVLNGTLVGKHVASYNQDLFLGVPFAQPPVGSLRFENPQSLNTTFGVRNATEYSDSCVGYGNTQDWPTTLSEDCLTLNIIRPAHETNCVRKRDDLLPVAVFLHGGGWASDFSANGVYNLSFIVEESVNMGRPIMAVSVEYRLSFWGFLASKEIVDADVANLGLKDQHLSLRWIKENIAAFGGDPEKVTIFGESAGGGNVGYMATAYGGRDEGLFRGMIAQSGADGSHMKDLTGPQQRFDTIVGAVGCNDSSDKLACLREVPFEELNATITLVSGGFTPIVDGTFVPDYPSSLLSEGKFVKAPLLVGTNSDEGTLFGQANTDTDPQFEALVRSKGVDDETVAILSALYPNVDALGLPADYRVVPGAVGSQFKRAMAFQTDQMFLSWTRLRSSAWAEHGVPTYAYLFQTNFRVRGRAQSGTSHFGEIAFVFYNLIGNGYQDFMNPFLNPGPGEVDHAKLTSRMWISFVNDLNPNNHEIADVPEWPLYNATGGYGEVFNLRPNDPRPIPDTFRLAGTTYMNDVAQEQFGR